MFRKASYLLAILISLSFILGACAGDVTEPPTAPPTDVPDAEPAPTDAEDLDEPEVEEPEPSEPEEMKTELFISGALPYTSLDPHAYGPVPWEKQLMLSVHDTLIGTENALPRGEIVPRLATDWSVSDDGLLYTFKLREDVVWQFGYGPFTADDVVYTYERLMDPERSGRAGLVTDFIKEVRAVDDYTVEIELLIPYVDFVPQILLNNYSTSTIMSKAAVEDRGEQGIGLNPVGTGPYQVIENVPGEYVTLERNPDYWGDPPQVERFTFLHIMEESLRADALETGELDIGSFRQPPTTERLSQNPNLKVHISYERPCVWQLAVDDNVVPDVNVRKAIAHAINKQELADTVLKYRSGANVVSYNGPGLPGFPDGATEELYPYDPELAKELLAEAGYEPGELTLQFPTRTDYADFSEAIAGYLEAVGINTVLEVQERAVFNETRKDTEAYDIYPGNPGRPTVSQFAAWLASPARTNMWEATGIPERVSELYNQQSVEQDPEVRAEMIQEMFSIIEEELPWIVFGYCTSPATIYHSYIDGPFDNWAEALQLPLEFITIDQEAYREQMNQ